MHIMGKVCMDNESVSLQVVRGRNGAYSQGQSSATLGIDQEQGRNCENDLDGTIAQGSEQGLVIAIAHSGKDT
jgi:hypothetical protein